MSASKDTFVSLFDKMRQKHPTKECYVAYDANLKRSSLTFREMWTLSSRFAHILREHGLKRGQYVMVTSPVSLENTVACLGVMLAGGSCVPMEKFFPNCEMIEETNKLCKNQIMIVVDDVCDIWEYLKGQSSNFSPETYSADYNNDTLFIRKILFTPKARGTWKTGFLDYLDRCTEEYVDSALIGQDGAMVCASLNPGMAVPKLVEHSHGSFVAMGHTWVDNINFGKGLYAYPMFLVSFFPFDIMFGRTRVIIDFYEKPVEDLPQQILAVSNAESVQNSLLTPADIRKMLEVASASPKLKLPVLDNVVSGGMPMTNAFFEGARQLAQNILICYAASEANLMSFNRLKPGDTFTPFDCGKPVKDVLVRIVNAEGNDLPAGQTGIIAIKTDQIFLRYVGEPGRTKSAKTKDGWYLTGDAGSIRQSDGNLFVYGRKSDAISRGIVLTYPGWLEKPIAQHPEVMDVVVVGVPDDINFNNTCACVVKRRGSNLTKKDIIQLVVGSIDKNGTDYFALDEVVFFEGSLPKMSREDLGVLAAQKLGIL